jgi:hypothetical protein
VLFLFFLFSSALISVAGVNLLFVCLFRYSATSCENRVVGGAGLYLVKVILSPVLHYVGTRTYSVHVVGM